MKTLQLSRWLRENGLEDLWPIICFVSRRHDFLSWETAWILCLCLERTLEGWQCLSIYWDVSANVYQLEEKTQKKAGRKWRSAKKTLQNINHISRQRFCVVYVKRKIFSMAFSIIERNIISLSWFLSLLKSLSAVQFPAGNRFIGKMRNKLGLLGKIVISLLFWDGVV